jgi:GH15 family glucan-1,4-alpha-glucosidase
LAYQPIENYGMIGNMRTIALAGMNGSIDWYCYPYFDSPSVFGALLDDKKGGRFRITPVSDKVTHRQIYWPETNVLVTRFLQEDGIAELEDFMPVGLPEDSLWKNDLFRRVKCVKGSVQFQVECTPAFDYGRKTHVVTIGKGGARFKSEDFSLALLSSVPFEKEGSGVSAKFTLEEGQCAEFVLQGILADQQEVSLPTKEQFEELFKETVKYWRNWLSACTYEGRWRQQVYRSALTLKLLKFAPTGAIIAAPTASLPEAIGGARNWDYRYTWIRDAAFTMYALLRIGFKDEAAGFMNWIKNYAKFYQSKPAHTLFRIFGGNDLAEINLDHWEGYRRSSPVRIGNEAAEQFQNDIYGELLDGLYLFNKYVEPVSYDAWVKVRRRLNWISENWQRPDEGIWEFRGAEKQFVYSKIMNWVALDRGIRLAEKRSLPSDSVKWTQVRDQIYEEVMEKGWNEKLQCFTQFYGSDNLDASLLIMPLVFFLAPSDKRMLSTIQAILKSPKEGGLVSDGLVYRYTPNTDGIDDKTGVQEGTFNMCSFWLVEAMTRAGKTNPDLLDEARLLFERMLRYSNHLGLYSEQTGNQGEALGNFPQAFTHLALISAAFNLDRELGNQP